MAHRSSDRGGGHRARRLLTLGSAAVVTAALTAQSVSPAQNADALSKRAAERLTALQTEAEQLAGRERTLLNELRRLELDREIKLERLSALERDAAAVRAQIAAAGARAQALEADAARQRPDVEARLVRLYKLGRAGYWRLLLDVDSLRQLGRAYRTAAALSRIDRDRIDEHRRTIASLARERQTLQARGAELARLEAAARRASEAVEAAVAARTARVAEIDERRDLNAQLAGELQDAQRRLQATLAQIASGSDAPAAALPLRPFRGALPWPAEGVVSSKFGEATRGGPASSKNGIQVSLPEGEGVHAVHDGVVAYAGPFSGYGELVILDHGVDRGSARGERSYSLYGHLSGVAVKKGDRVAEGATVGLTGRDPAGNPALYFELRVDGAPVDPLLWLKRH
jgi:septal ring factor EnvC (AmiA/AmiB activator)